MKGTILSLILLVSILFACKKADEPVNEDDNGLPVTAETKSEYNNTNFGVYKGVIVGSSGLIVFKINNGDNVVKGYLTIDNQKDTLTTTTNITLGQPISNVLFTGRISSMKVSANADGSNAMLSNIQINGHNNVTGYIIHENSNNQVLCYEGTFNGTSTGIINATRLTNADSTYFLSKVYQVSNVNGTLINVNDTTLYRGYGWNYPTDSTKGYLWGQNYTPIYFTIAGKFNNLNSTTSTFNGKWNGAYGSGNFTCSRTY